MNVFKEKAFSITSLQSVSKKQTWDLIIILNKRLKIYAIISTKTKKSGQTIKIIDGWNKYVPCSCETKEYNEFDLTILSREELYGSRYPDNVKKYIYTSFITQIEHPVYKSYSIDDFRRNLNLSYSMRDKIDILYLNAISIFVADGIIPMNKPLSFNKFLLKIIVDYYMDDAINHNYIDYSPVYSYTNGSELATIFNLLDMPVMGTNVTYTNSTLYNQLFNTTYISHQPLTCIDYNSLYPSLSIGY